MPDMAIFLLIAALVVFILAALPKVSISAVNLVPLGLALLTLAFILGGR